MATIVASVAGVVVVGSVVAVVAVVVVCGQRGCFCWQCWGNSCCCGQKRVRFITNS